jgi:DNA-directed RNA polymerase alpha subunit
MIGTFIQVPIAKYWPEGRCKAQFNALHKEGVITLGDALKRTEAEILRIPVCGRGTLYVLRQVLQDGMREYLEEVS